MSATPEPGRDRLILFATRVLRLIAYGALAVVLALYLTRVGMSGREIGLLLSLTLVGDAAITLWLTTVADRVGRRTTLVIGAALMVLGGCAFALTDNLTLLLLAATIGVISPSGNEVGPFLSIEQAALSQVVHDTKRTGIFAWYSLAGSLATAAGSLIGGAALYFLGQFGVGELSAYKMVLLFYAGCGAALGVMFVLLSSAVEVGRETEPSPARQMLGLHESRPVVMKLSALFALDAFGGGFVVQSLLAWWFNERFHVSGATLGMIFFFANLFAGLSHLAAARLAGRFGLINTMVYTHLPSNVLLMLVPLMPTFHWAVIVLMLRFAISQMDVPTRQSYTMAVVRPTERSAAAGITGVARTIGAALAFPLAAPMIERAALMNAPLYIAGALKIIYDLLLYRSFLKLKPPEELDQMPIVPATARATQRNSDSSRPGST